MSNLTYMPEDLSIAATRLFIAAGLRASDAVVIADDLVAANVRGLDSHGVSRIPMYLERIRRGLVNPCPELRVHSISPAVALLDGDDGMGFLAAHRAIELGIELAEASGIGLVGVRHSTHFGMASLYVQQAIDAGYIALAYTNSSPALPVWGGKTAFLGASPFAAGIPGGRTSPPFVLDMAMTVIARGKIRMAAMHGEPIPPGLALDADGAPTTDASKAFEGVCLPFGGAKGGALAMLMDLLSGMLTGANYGGEVKSLYYDHSEPQNVGHLFFVLKPDLFLPREAFDQRMDTFAERVKALPKAQGFDEILIPGEPEERRAAERKATGIPLSPLVVQSLVQEGERYGVDFMELVG